ncbi:MAG: bifunctional UDP-sugar hydrolase/5'-nucleotidase [Candidatus Binatia bacterium]
MRRNLFVIFYIPVLTWFTVGYWTLHTAHAQDVCTIGHEHDEAGEDSLEMRESAAQPVEWRAFQTHIASMAAGNFVPVQLLAINDFHGQLSEGRFVSGRPVGSAAVLAAYLKAAQVGQEDHTFIVHAGDHVGASPPASALLQDEPSIMFLDLLANNHCSGGSRRNPGCNIIGTLGNHEFDEGKEEMLRLIWGGRHPDGSFLEKHYNGARFPYVSANVVDKRTGNPILPPYVITKVKATPIAFIGAVLKDTPTIVTPLGVAGLKFLDEADAINRYIPELKKKGVRTIVVLIHQGGRQTTYGGQTDPTRTAVDGPNILDIVDRLDDEVDVVVSGHAHSFTNALLPNQNGKEILVTQAFSAGTAYADIDLEIDPKTKDVVSKTAAVITTFADAGPGLNPDLKTAQLTLMAEDKVAPLVNRLIGVASTNLLDDQNLAGESALGNLIADSQRAAMGTDFAFMNPGGIRADLAVGDVTWGNLFTIQPFGNSLVKMNLTGQHIYDVLNQQWAAPQPFPRILQISGLTYTWDNNLPAGNRVVEVRKNGVPINLTATYSVTANNFIAAGGDNFTIFTLGTNLIGGPIDLDALIPYTQSLPQPFSAAIEGRITRLN